MKKVDYWKLLEKAKNQYGITGKLGKRHHNFLHNRKQPILVEEITPLETKVVSGAVQGSILGPIWFQIFIGDLTQNKTASTKFFVDDAQIKKRVMAGEEDVEDLQSNLDTPRGETHFLVFAQTLIKAQECFKHSGGRSLVNYSIKYMIIKTHMVYDILLSSWQFGQACKIIY